jgi:hypothetical protein
LLQRSTHTLLLPSLPRGCAPPSSTLHCITKHSPPNTNPTQPNTTQHSPIQLNPIQFNPTQHNPNLPLQCGRQHPNPTQPNPAQFNPTPPPCPGVQCGRHPPRPGGGAGGARRAGLDTGAVWGAHPWWGGVIVGGLGNPMPVGGWGARPEGASTPRGAGLDTGTVRGAHPWWGGGLRGRVWGGWMGRAGGA